MKIKNDMNKLDIINEAIRQVKESNHEKPKTILIYSKSRKAWVMVPNDPRAMASFLASEPDEN
jgi:hypothetical protein